jgi:hypothetical protein
LRVASVTDLFGTPLRVGSIPAGLTSRGGRRKCQIGVAGAISFAEQRGYVFTDQGARSLPRPEGDRESDAVVIGLGTAFGSF